MDSNFYMTYSTHINEIVRANYSTAKVFEKYSLDFYCNSNRSLKVSADEKGIKIDSLIKELSLSLKTRIKKEERYDEWSLVALSNYIVDNHHTYAREAIPRIQSYIEQTQKNHGEKYKFIRRIMDLFQQISKEMLRHMEKEERFLFHVIRYIEECKHFNEIPRTRGYGTVKDPIKTMENEHEGSGNIMEEIRSLTDNYTLPSDAGEIFTMTYKELEEFEKDLHKHLHLENNILFPKAITLEEGSTKTQINILFI